MNTLTLTPEERKKLLPYYQLARNIAVVALGFSLLVIIILIISFWQFQTYDPINSPHWPKLIEQIHAGDTGSALLETARAYDLLSRKAYFTSLAFQRFGAYLLLAGLSLFLLAFKSASELKRRLPVPDQGELRSELAKEQRLLQWSLLIVCLVLTATAFTLPLLSTSTWRIPKPALKPDQVLPLAASQAALQTNWPAFRGFNSLAKAADQRPPVGWEDNGPGSILWKTKLDKPGFNSPIIWEDMIFLSGADQSGRQIYCFDLATGQLRWQQGPSRPTRTLPEVTDDTGLAAPTMATNGQVAAALFATGELLVLDFNGNLVWEKQLPTPDNHYGHASSLLTYQDLLLIQYDHNQSAACLAFELATGSQVWQQDRSVEISWASPLIAPTSQGDQLILVSTPLVMAYDPLTGRPLWQLEETVDGEIGPSAAYANDIVYVINQYSALTAIAIKSPKILWQSFTNLSDIPSPAAAEELLLVPTSFGLVSCFQAASGKLLWKHRFDHGFTASPIIVNDRVYLLDKTGVMHVIKLSDRFALLASSSINEAVTATPAFKDDKIIIRGEKHLFCIGSEQP